MELTEKILKRFQTELKKLKPKRNGLKTIHYTSDGHVEFTNSHSAIRLTNCHSLDEKTVPDTNTTYPDMTRIFASLENNESIQLNVLEFRNMVAPFKTEKFDYVKLLFTSEGIGFTAPVKSFQCLTKASLKVDLNIDENNSFEIAINPEYLYNCLQLFNVLKIKQISMKYSSPVRPLLFEFDNLQYIITPMRVS